MSHPVKVNINQSCLIRETPVGFALYKKHYQELGLDWSEYRKYDEQPDGRLKLQLWELCRFYGAACANGAPVPFETEIEILMEDV